MKFTYIKLSKNQDKVKESTEDNHIKTGYSRGKHALSKNEKNDKEKILNVKSEERFLNKGYKSASDNYKDDEKKEKIKKLLNKNQVALYAISLMLITSGYFNYTNNLKMASIGDAQLVSANLSVDEDETNTNLDENEVTNQASTELDKNEETSTNFDENKITSENNITSNYIIQNTIESSSNNVKSSEYFAQTKLDRDKMYSQMIETYQKILENNNISTEQKNTASEEIKNINNKRNGISTSETLIKTKGIEDIVIMVNSEVIDAIVKSKENISDEQVAQISNIIARELNSDIENIHITTHE